MNPRQGSVSQIEDGWAVAARRPFFLRCGWQGGVRVLEETRPQSEMLRRANGNAQAQELCYNWGE